VEEEVVELAHRKAVLPVLAVQEAVVMEAQLEMDLPELLIQEAVAGVATQVLVHLAAQAAPVS
jgi:hypothetical protein